jgi:hypothetical protein
MKRASIMEKGNANIRISDEDKMSERVKKVFGELDQAQSNFGPDHQDECLFIVGLVENMVISGAVATASKSPNERLLCDVFIKAMEHLKDGCEEAYYGAYTAIACAIISMTDKDEHCQDVLQHLIALKNDMRKRKREQAEKDSAEGSEHSEAGSECGEAGSERDVVGSECSEASRKCAEGSDSAQTHIEAIENALNSVVNNGGVKRSNHNGGAEGDR